MASSCSSRFRHHDSHRFTVQPSDDFRQRALARLYERRSAVGNLIDALEQYQQTERGLRMQQATATDAAMSS